MTSFEFGESNGPGDTFGFEKRRHPDIIFDTDDDYYPTNGDEVLEPEPDEVPDTSSEAVEDDAPTSILPAAKPEEPEWVTQGLCYPDDELWLDPLTAPDAIAICRNKCPVRRECLQEDIDNGAYHRGVRGGFVLPARLLLVERKRQNQQAE